MSTAIWAIDRETAEIIMPSGRESFDMDRAWPRNGAVYSANQYEWCHIFDGGIECPKCGIEHLLKGDEAYESRKNDDGKMDFCTYEFTEMMHCDCGVTLGGWEENCSDCGEWCSTYDNARLHLFGYIGEVDGSEIVFSTDDIPPADVYDSVRPICGPCLDQGYVYDFLKDVAPHPYGDTPAWKIERIDEEDE